MLVSLQLMHSRSSYGCETVLICSVANCANYPLFAIFSLCYIKNDIAYVIIMSFTVSCALTQELSLTEL